MFLKTVLCEEAHLIVKFLTKSLHLALKELSWLQKVICNFEQIKIINIRRESNQIPFFSLKFTSLCKEITYYITPKKLDRYFSEQIHGFLYRHASPFSLFFAS